MYSITVNITPNGERTDMSVKIRMLILKELGE